MALKDLFTSKKENPEKGFNLPDRTGLSSIVGPIGTTIANEVYKKYNSGLERSATDANKVLPGAGQDIAPTPTPTPQINNFSGLPEVDYGSSYKTGTPNYGSSTNTQQQSGGYSNVTGSDIYHTMDYLGKTFGNMSPVELYQLRQKLAYEQGLAGVGMVPGQRAVIDDVVTNLTGTKPVYNYDQLNQVNRSYADMYNPQLEAIDSHIKALENFDAQTAKLQGSSGYGLGQNVLSQTDNGSNYGIDVNQIAKIASKFGGTAAERKELSDMMINAYATGGIESFIDNISMYGQQNMSADERKRFDTANGNVQTLDLALYAISNYDGNLGNFKNIKNNLLKTFSKQDPEYEAIAYLTETVFAKERNEIFGASLTPNEQSAASKFVVDEKDTKETAIRTIKQTKVALETANEAMLLRSAGLSPKQIENLKNQGAIKSLADRLAENGLSVPPTLFPQNGINKETGEEVRWINNKGEYIPLNETQSFSQVGSGTNIASNSTTGNVNGLEDALRRIARNESDGSGGYAAIGPVVTEGMYKGQRALGKYQVMEGNIGPWSKEILGYEITPKQFYGSPEAQEAIVRGKFQQLYKQYGNWSDVASVWFTGQPVNKAIARGAKDTLGTTVQQYVNKFNS